MDSISNHKNSLEDRRYKHLLDISLPYIKASSNSFYQTLFPEGSLSTDPIDGEGLHAILIRKQENETSSISVYDQLTPLLSITQNDGVDYYHSVIAYNDRDIAWRCHALVLDLCCFKRKMECGEYDSILIQKLLAAIKNEKYPCPTFIVNSGHGYQLYFVFDTPLHLYPEVVKELGRAKKRTLSESAQASGQIHLNRNRRR